MSRLRPADLMCPAPENGCRPSPPPEPALMGDGDGLQRRGDRCLDAGRRAAMARQRDVQVVTLLGPGSFSGNEQPVDTTLQGMDRADAGPETLCAWSGRRGDRRCAQPLRGARRTAIARRTPAGAKTPMAPRPGAAEPATHWRVRTTRPALSIKERPVRADHPGPGRVGRPDGGRRAGSGRASHVRNSRRGSRFGLAPVMNASRTAAA